MDVALRPVDPADLDLFFELQADPIQVATTVPARDRPAFDAWVADMASDPSREWLSITADGVAVGNILSFELEGVRYVGYRLANDQWGRGIATSALQQYIVRLPRPLHATVLATNVGSVKVLERAGFVQEWERTDLDGVTELGFVLTA